MKQNITCKLKKKCLKKMVAVHDEISNLHNSTFLMLRKNVLNVIRKSCEMVWIAKKTKYDMKKNFNRLKLFI